MIKRMSEVEDAVWNIPRMKEDVLQHLYYRWIIRAGDAGLHNILLVQTEHCCNQLVAGNDLEETRTSSDDRNLDGITSLFKNGTAKSVMKRFEGVMFPPEPKSQIKFVVSTILSS